MPHRLNVVRAIALASILSLVPIAHAKAAIPLPSAPQSHPIADLKLPARPDFFEAYPAALAEAQKAAAAEGVAGDSVYLMSAAGAGLDASGQMVSEEAFQAAVRKGSVIKELAQPHWAYYFSAPATEGAETHPSFQVTVNEDGKTGTVATFRSPNLIPPLHWTLSPRTVVAPGKAVANAAADGLKSEIYAVGLSPSLNTEGKPWEHGPLAYGVVGLSNLRGSRVLLARTGAIYATTQDGKVQYRMATPKNLNRARAMMQGWAGRWFIALGGGSRAIAPQDIAQATGIDLPHAQLFVHRHDRNGNGLLSQQEIIDWASSDQVLQDVLATPIGYQFWRLADQDLSMDASTATRAALRTFDPSGQEHFWPLSITRTEFNRYDANHDGRLTIDEYIPLGLQETHSLLAGNPKAAMEFARTLVSNL